MIKDSVFYLIARILPSLINIISLSVYTRIFTTLEYGYFAILLGVSTLVNALLFEWIKTGYIRFQDRHTDEIGKLYFSIVIIQLLLITILVFSTAIIYLNGIVTLTESILGLFFVLSLSAYSFQLAYLRATFQTKKYVLSSLNRAISVFVITIFLSTFISGEMALAIGTISGYGIMTGPLLIKAFKYFKPKYYNKLVILEFFTYSYPFIFTLSTAVIIYNLDRLMLGLLIDVNSAGSYSAVSNFGMSSIAFVLGSISLATFPHILKSYNKKEDLSFYEKIDQTLTLIILCSVPIALYFIFYNSFISSIMFAGEFYNAAIIVLPLIVIASLIEAFKSTYVEIPVKLSKKTSQLIKPALVGIIINLILNYVWIKQSGIVGAAYSTVCTYIIMCIYSYVLNKKIVKLFNFTKDIKNALVISFIFLFLIWIFHFVNFNELFEIIILSVIYLIMIIKINVFKVQSIVKRLFRSLQNG